MKLHHRAGEYQNLAEINITPFVDVVLVLLIIFMITAPLMQQGFTVNLPSSKSPEVKSTSKDVILSIDRNGKFFLSDIKQPISADELTPKLYTIYRTKEQKDLFIQADQNLPYKKVVEAMSIAHQAGVERIGMMTQSDKK